MEGNRSAAAGAKTQPARRGPAWTSVPSWWPKARTQDFVYKKTPQGELKLTVHYPPDWKADDKRPAIVFFFGGGWRGGTTEQFRPQADYLAARGMVAARSDYRVKTRHGTGREKCVEDAKSAVRYLRANAGSLGIDGDRIVGSGGSAGGHLAIAAFTTPGLEAEGEDEKISSKPNLLVLFNPVLDLTDGNWRNKAETDELAKNISPSLNLSDRTPPAIMFFGADDKLVSQARRFIARSRELGNEAGLWIADGVSHGFFNRPPWRQTTLYLTEQFLARHGYLKGKGLIPPPRGKAVMKLVSSRPQPATRQADR